LLKEREGSGLSPVLDFPVTLLIEENSDEPILTFFQGIWWGMVAGVLLQTITLIILTARTNWDTEVT
jgi:Na+-driven multidrug efflux pump